MRRLEGAEADRAHGFLAEATHVATSALCHRSRCGSVIVAGGKVIGRGANSPADGCALAECFKGALPAAFRSDRTCCVHAEQRAILDALRRHPNQVAGARLHFIRLDEHGQPAPAGAPYCTICSKMTQVAGISEFVLLHPEGITVYGADEYNRLSFRHADPATYRRNELAMSPFNPMPPPPPGSGDAELAMWGLSDLFSYMMVGGAAFFVVALVGVVIYSALPGTKRRDAAKAAAAQAVKDEKGRRRRAGDDDQRADDLAALEQLLDVRERKSLVAAMVKIHTRW